MGEIEGQSSRYVVSWDWLGITGDARIMLKLSIWDRIVGLRLRDMDSMVGTVLTIEREVEDTWNTRDTDVGS